MGENRFDPFSYVGSNYRQERMPTIDTRIFSPLLGKTVRTIFRIIASTRYIKVSFTNLSASGTFPPTTCHKSCIRTLKNFKP